MKRALESDTMARDADIGQLILLLLLRQSSLVNLGDEHPHKEIIRQGRDSAEDEIKWRFAAIRGDEAQDNARLNYLELCAKATLDELPEGEREYRVASIHGVDCFGETFREAIDNARRRDGLL